MSAKNIVITIVDCREKSGIIKYLSKELETEGVKACFIESGFDSEITDQQFAGVALKHLNDLKVSKEDKENSLYVFFSGIPDVLCYFSKNKYNELLKLCKLNEVIAREQYGAVFFVDGENVEKNSQNKTGAWVGHNHMRIIGRNNDFSNKVKQLKEEILFYLGIPESLEIERKFLIEYPDIKKLESMYNCRGVEIEQIYLVPKEGCNRRIRMRGEKGNYIYYLTEKRKISELVRMETERIICKEEYTKLKEEADSRCKPIVKTRYCLAENDMYWEIDVFPFWNDKALMEIELLREDQSYVLPGCTKVIRDVTREDDYTNRALSMK